MARPKRSIEDRLLEAQVAIDNSLNIPTILNAVSAFGYDQPRLQAARALYDAVMVLVAAQKREYGDQYEATAVLQTTWDNADAAYKRTLKVCRILFKGNTGAAAALELSGSRKKSLSGWLEQVPAFYINLLGNADYITALAEFGYDQARLEAEAVLVQAVVDANAAQNKERGEAQDATLARDAKLDELDAWVARYKKVAQLALEESPQMLEQLGWVVKA